MTKHDKKTAATVAGMGVALAAAAAAGYFLYGKDGAKNRKKVKGWMLKAKGEVLEKLEEAKHVSEPMYRKIVSGVAKRYASLKNVDKKDLAQMAKELQGHWKSIKRHIGTAKPKAKKKARA